MSIMWWRVVVAGLLDGKVALVAGAGRGIGRTIAVTLARAGAAVAVCARTTEQVQDTVAELRGLGCSALGVPADVADAGQVEALVRQVLAEYGRIDVLVCNAGIIGPIGPTVELDPAQWLETLRVNLFGQFLCCRAVTPAMIERRQGKIVNVTGAGFAGPVPYLGAYAASKAAVVRFAETLAAEVAPFDVQVNALNPGMVYGRMWEEIDAAGARAGAFLASRSQRMKTGEDGISAERAGQLALFLCSARSGKLTGRVLSVYDNWEAVETGLPAIEVSEAFTLRVVQPGT